MTVPSCSSEAEINTVTGSAVAFSKNLISRISNRFKGQKPPPLRPIRCAPERVSEFSCFLILVKLQNTVLRKKFRF